MKRLMTLIIVVLLALAWGSRSPYALENQIGAPATHSKDFERMKDLLGVWEGKSEMGKGIEQLRVTYELTSAGNAIVERFDAGRPHEMITVYHDYNGKLSMTHYCSLGNQPHMELTNPGGDNLMFVLSGTNPGLATMTEAHMHTLNITIEGKDNITQTWTLYDKGTKKSDVVVKLVRTKM